MNAIGPGDGLSVSYVHDDKQRRAAFDHELAGYIRRHGERWDLTAIVELWVPITSSTSCDQVIFVDHASDVSLFSDAVQVEVDRLG
jgi:hypothetical protein